MPLMDFLKTENYIEKWFWPFSFKSGDIVSIYQKNIDVVKNKVNEIETLWFIYDTIDLILEGEIKILPSERINLISTGEEYTNKTNLKSLIDSLTDEWIKKVSAYVDNFYFNVDWEIQRQLTAIRHLLSKWV
jgi:hypothetical protein